MSHGINTARRNLFRGLPLSAPAPVRPPGALSEAQFVDACTRCEDCLNQCPQGIITKGQGGLPEIDFSSNECTFCNLCIEVCDSGALSDTTTPPWTLELTLSDDCLAVKQVVCQSCRDECDQLAITFVPQLGRVATPRIDQDACTGCGACVAPCPSNALSLHPLDIGQLPNSEVTVV